MTRFFRWAARGHADLHLGRTAEAVERTYYRVSRRLSQKRVNGVGATELADIMLGPGYATFLYPEAAAALSESPTMAPLASRATRTRHSTRWPHAATTATPCTWPPCAPMPLGPPT